MRSASFLLWVLLLNAVPVMAQPELQPWGNLAGIRVEGQLMEFETNISIVRKGWTSIKETGKEMQRPGYERKGNQQIVTTDIDSLHFVETVTSQKNNSANIRVQLLAKANELLEGVYIKMLVPDAYYPPALLCTMRWKAFRSPVIPPPLPATSGNP